MIRPAFLATFLLLAGCHRPNRGEEGAPRAVVLSGAARSRDSEAVARVLNERGYDVLRKSTTIVRRPSSAAVYAVLADPERPDRLRQALEEAGVEAEVLPFPYHAAGGNLVVVWLGDDAPAAK